MIGTKLLIELFPYSQIDWIGALLITAGLVLVVFVLNDASVAPQGWKTDCKHQGFYSTLSSLLTTLQSPSLC